MISKPYLSAASVIFLGCVGLVLAQSAATPPAPASPAAQPEVDPNWIGPQAWERHFTIPPFKETPQGIGWKAPTTRPASEDIPSVFLRRRASTDSNTTTTSARPTRSGRGEGAGMYSDRSDRSSRSSSRSERSSTRSSSRSSRTSRSSRY